MNALNLGIDWLSKIKSKYDKEKAYKIITGFSEVFDKINSFEPDVRDEILKLFLEIWEKSKTENE